MPPDDAAACRFGLAELWIPANTAPAAVEQVYAGSG
jgi:hypothetical protein